MTKKKDYVDKLVDAAIQHGEDTGDFEMTIGDLEIALRFVCDQLMPDTTRVVQARFQELIAEWKGE